MTTSPPPSRDRQPTATGESESKSEDATDRRLGSGLVASIRVVSFWLAIVLPFLYVPLLATGLSDAAETFAFLGLFTMSVLSLYVGHSHRAD